MAQLKLAHWESRSLFCFSQQNSRKSYRKLRHLLFKTSQAAKFPGTISALRASSGKREINIPDFSEAA
jgi:hypothetical protein